MNSRLRLLLIATLALPVAVAGCLYLFSRGSTAYEPAVQAVLASKVVAAYLGETPRATLLLGIRQNIGTTSCSTVTFRVAGTERYGFVSVFLVQTPGARWEAKEFAVGLWSQGQRVCSDFR